jgi:methyl-accepting chemotaxis protein
MALAATTGNSKGKLELAAEPPPGSEPEATEPEMRVRFSLGAKITTVLAVVLVALGLVTVWMVADQMETALLSQFESKGVGIARSLGSNAAEFLIDDRRTNLQGIIDDFNKIDGVRYIAIADPAGKIINHTIAPEFPAPLTDAITRMVAPGSEDVNIAMRRVNVGGIGLVLDISLPILNGVLGVAHVGMNLDQIESAIFGISVKVAVVFLAFLGLGAVLASGLSRLIIRPLDEIMRVLLEVSRGNLNVSTKVDTLDELALLSKRTNGMIRSLRDLVTSVLGASAQVSDAAEEILATSQTQEQGASEQTASLEEMSSSMSALADTARAIASNAATLTQEAEQVSSNVTSGQHSLTASREAMEQIVRQNELVSDRINKLYEQSQSIIAIVDIIDNISDRLDLLALNAALEGSRAGEVGKGFSLVAQEMRRLAENVVGSTREIKQTVQQIHQFTQASLDASRQSTQATDRGNVDMEQMVGTMQQIFDLIERTTGAARQITIITQQQLSSSQQMVGAMNEIASIQTEALGSAQQVTKAARDLATLSASLRDRVGAFGLKGR